MKQGNFINGEKSGNWYYKNWKDECWKCNVKEFIFENNEWKSAKIEYGDSMCYYYRVNSRIYVVEYKNDKIVRKTGFWVPADNKFPELKKGHINELFNLHEKDGDYEEYDEEEMIVVKGAYQSTLKRGTWTYYYYDQNCVMSRNLSASSEIFMTIDSDKPYSGKVTISEGDYIYVITVKKGMRNGITKIYEKGKDKPYAKEKYKDGLKVE